VLEIPVYAYLLPTIQAVVLAVYETPVTYELSNRLDDISWLLCASGQIALVMCLVELALGFKLCCVSATISPASSASGGKPSSKAVLLDSFTRILRYQAAGAMAVLWVVAVVYFAFESVFVTGFYQNWVIKQDVTWFAREGVTAMQVVRKLQTAFVIIVFAASLCVAGLAVSALRSIQANYRKDLKSVSIPEFSGLCEKLAHMHSRQSATLYLVACAVFLIFTTWELVYQLTWLLKPDYDSRDVPLYVVVLEPVLGQWPILAVLVLVFVIGRRDEGGLWAKRQNCPASDSESTST
jgi:hypothetical protein